MGDKSTTAEIVEKDWRRTFCLLAAIELGGTPRWDGPSDLVELRLRVETLAVLLGVVPRLSLDRLPQIVAVLSRKFPIGIPDLHDVRASVRVFLGGAKGLTINRNNNPFNRAKDFLARGGSASGHLATEPGDRQSDREVCELYVGKWLAMLEKDGPWTRIRPVLSDQMDLNVDDVYVDLFAIPDRDIEQALDGKGESVRRVTGSPTKESNPSIDVSTMLARIGTFTVVVGEPGGGKSTLVQWIARHAGKQQAPDFDAAFAVKLGRYALELDAEPDLGLVEYFFQEVGSRELGVAGAAAWLRNCGKEGGRFMLLLDGWDEVPVELRDRVEEMIRHERSAFTVLVTSRPSGFPRRLTTGGGTEIFHLAGLTPRSRALLAERYLQALGRTDLFPELMRRIGSDRDLQELAGNPFMLSLLTWAAVSGRLRYGDEWTPAKLYSNAVDWIVGVSASNRSSVGRYLPSALLGLGRLSYTLLFRDPLPRYAFKTSELTQAMAPEEADAVTESRFLNCVDVTGHNLAFVHATFQEYFAATHAGCQSESISRQTLERSFLSEVRGVVIEFMVGLESQAGELARDMLRTWFCDRDRFGHVVFRVAKYLAACPESERPRSFTNEVIAQVWARVNSTRDMVTKERGVALIARLDPAALCAFVRGQPKPDQFLLDVVFGSVPWTVWESERMSDLLDPAMRDRVDAEILYRTSPDTLEDERRTIQESSDADAIMAAARRIGAARDLSAIPVLVGRLRVPSLPVALQRELVTSIGLIGGPEATRVLVDLVVGDLRVSSVAAGVARRALQHSEGGGARLDTCGRDKLLRRIASMRTDSPLLIRILSALLGLPARGGIDLMRHLAFSRDVEPFTRTECLEVLSSSLSDGELEELLGGLSHETPDVEAILLATAVRRHVAIPIAWISERLRTSSRVPDKEMLLTVAIAMACRPINQRLGADGLLRQTLVMALSGSSPYSDDLAVAFERALAGFDGIPVRGFGWVDAALCETKLRSFLERDTAVPSAAVRLAATALGWEKTESTATILRSLIAACHRREDGLLEMQISGLREIALVGAHALARVDPEALLEFPTDWPPAQTALREKSSNQGWLVYNDRIIDGEGRRPDSPVRSRRKSAVARRATITTAPFPFTDLSPRDFERLVHAYLIATRWPDAEWIGQAGRDGGVDIQNCDEAGRVTVFLCANYQKPTLQKARSDMTRLIECGNYPDEIYIIFGGVVDANLRKKIRDAAAAMKLPVPSIWSGPELDNWLHRDTPELIKRFSRGGAD